jgi:type IV secretory pathway VirB10-like protein
VVNEPEQTRAPQDGEPVAALRLRSERPPVMRLSRKVLTGLASVAAITVAGALIWALYQGNKKSGGGPELYNTENKTTPDGLSSLPRDYAGIAPPPAGSGIPPLGPPLPGDIGRPVPGAQGPSPGAVDPEQQRIAQEAEAARTSRLFATTSTRERPAAPATVAPSADQKTATPAGQPDVPPIDPESLLNMQDRKTAFLNGPVDRKTVSPDRLENPASRYVVQAGAVIAAALITGIRSDLPGQVTAQVTESVYDSPSGSFLLIPQGAKLVGAYDSQISFGQDRVLLVWTRLIMPNGRSIVLERQPGADTQGFTGLEDEVDQHWGRLAMAAALSTVLGVGAELGATNNDSAVVTALRRGTTDSLNQTGQQVVRRNLNIQPTITIRPGFPVRVIVNRDLVLAPYQS